MNISRRTAFLLIALLITATAGFYYHYAGAAGGKIKPLTNKEKFNLAMVEAQTSFGKGNYAESIKYYKQAQRLDKKADTAHVGLYTAYQAQKKWNLALKSLDNAIKLYPENSQYWRWKLELMDETTPATYAELKKVYEEGLAKVDVRFRGTLVTRFATVAEANGEKEDAITAWELAKTLNPAKAEVYQQEINRLKAD